LEEDIEDEPFQANLQASQYNPGNPELQEFVKANGLAFAASGPRTQEGRHEPEFIQTS
jgi:hypothetical protein